MKDVGTTKRSNGPVSRQLPGRLWQCGSAVALSCPTGVPIQAGVATRVDVDSEGREAVPIRNAAQHMQSISVDGRCVVSDPAAPNLGPGVTNAMDDVFVRDRLLATTTRISVSSAGTQGNDLPKDAVWPRQPPRRVRQRHLRRSMGSRL